MNIKLYKIKSVQPAAEILIKILYLKTKPELYCQKLIMFSNKFTQ